MIEWSGGQVPSSLAEDLVNDALADTWLGKLAWKPGKRSLLKHIISTIESRARHARIRAKKFPTASLDAHEEADGDDLAAVLWTEAEEALVANGCAMNTGEMICTIDVFEHVRMLAAGDLEVLSLLDAMRAGAADRADLLQVTGMSARRYESSRRRLDTLLLELPFSMSRRVGGMGPSSESRAA